MAIRIQRSSKPLPAPPTTKAAARAAGAPPNMGTLEQIRELIPAEAAALYIAGLGVIPVEQLVVIVLWALLGLVFTILVKARQKDPQQLDQPMKTEWNQVIVAAGAFIIWIYALGGGPFGAFGWYLPWLATLLILAYTALSPWILAGFDKILPK